MTALALRSARPGDAPALDALKRACFPAAYLDLSVHRSPRSVAYLAALAAPALAPRHPILVAGDYDGYVQAVIRDEAIHLNYIGVHPRAEGRGLGGELLAAFHRLGREAGCRRATLDAFAGNARVRDWYARHGYAETGRSEIAVVDLTRVEPRPIPIVYRDLDLALAQETAQGFAMVATEGGYDGGHIGLVAGDTLRPRLASPLALDPAALTPTGLAGAMRADFPGRARLILSGETGELPTLDRQTSIRLERAL